MKKLKLISIVLIIGVIITCAYIAFFISPQGLKVKQYQLSSTRITEEFNDFKIGYFSDLDLKDQNDLTRLEKIINKINSEQYDLILFGGDIYDDDFFENTQVTSLLKKIEASHGKFAVLGEKDYTNANEATTILEHGGFEVLSNESRPIYYNNSAILLMGLENTGDLNTLINDSNSGYYKVVLVHQPDYFTNSIAHNIDLQLSGHSHGGYIYLPFLGVFNKIEGAITYNHGQYQENNSQLIVSNGIGMENGKTIRLFCTPDIISINLTQE